MPTPQGPAALVITGASRGIGLETARLFAEHGYRIVNLSRSPISVEGAVDITADLASPDWAEGIKDELDAALAGSGEISLVHNSAIQLPGAIDQVDAGDFRTTLELAVVAPSILNRLVLPHQSAGSSIIYVGSTLSQRASKGLAAYVASKHAVVGLMRSTAQDLGGSGIHTACVCPGFTNTEMLREYGGEATEYLKSLVHEKRLIDPVEIARVLFFAARNPVVNGSVLQAELCFVQP